MSNYLVNFSDGGKNPIEVVSQTKNDQTSISLIGRNYPGYGQAVAENFLHLLENFANTIQPRDPIEGQLWFDTGDYQLKVFDSGTWRPVNGVHQTVNEPSNKKVGDIWVDTQSDILYIWNSQAWVQIGPSFSTTLRTGAYPDQILGTDGELHDVIFMYLNDNAIEIIAKENFRPVQLIEGFINLVPGVNLTSKSFQNTAPQFNGNASAALALRQTSPATETVSANNFVRNDINQTINGRLYINDNNGITIGKNTGTFALQRLNNYEAAFINSWDGGKFSFKGTKDGVVSTVLTIDANSNRVGIGANNVNPEKELDVKGSGLISETFAVGTSTNVSPGEAFKVVGNALINGNLEAVYGVKVAGTSTFTNTVIVGVPNASNQSKNDAIIKPASTATYNLGTEANPFQTLYVREIRGGVITGTANTGTSFFGILKTTTPGTGDMGAAYRLEKSTRFKVQGAISGQGALYFGRPTDGIEDYVITTSLSKIAITDKTTATSAALSDSLVISIPADPNLKQITKADFLSDIIPGVLITGSIVPFAGNVTPPGWLFCDGSEFARVGQYNVLYSIIGTKFGYLSTGTFTLPNLNNPNTLYAATATNATVNPPPIKYIIKT
jgi:hypothetical protein